jgi:hypothetical protein
VTNTHRRLHSAISQFADLAGRCTDASALDGLLSILPHPPPHARIRTAVLFSTSALSDLLAEEGPKRLEGLRVLNPAVPAFSIEAVGQQEDRPSPSGIFALLPASQPYLSRLVSLCYSAFWHGPIRRLLRSIYPEAVPVYFKQDEIRDALIALELGLPPGQTLSVSEATLKRKSPHLAIHRSLETERLWTELSVAEVLERALEHGQWFTTIKLLVERRLEKTDSYARVASATLYKRGELSYDFLHTAFSHQFLPLLEAKASSRLTLLRARGIRERNYKPARPIQISFDDDPFSDPAELHRLAHVVAAYPDSTKAVLHPNPYYHASLADFADGSSFELWVLSSARILILPQAKSTQQAFERLVSYILLEFREGAVSEYAD